MKKIALLILSLILPMTMMSAQDQKYTFERFGFKSKYIPVPTVFDETVTVMGNPSKGSYYFYIPSENFQIDVEVKFLEYGDANTPFAYYYIGSGVVGYRQYNKVILSSNAKLSDIAKGGGNSRSTPYDEKYHVNVLFGQVDGLQVNDMLTCDLYFIKNPTEQEKQAKLEQERAAQAAELATFRRDSINKVNLRRYIAGIDNVAIHNVIENIQNGYTKKNLNIGSRNPYSGQIPKEYKVYIYIDSRRTEVIWVDYKVLDDDLYDKYNDVYNDLDLRKNNAYKVDGVTYYAVGDGFVFEKKIRQSMLYGYGDIYIKKKKNSTTYRDQHYAKLDSSDIPQMILEQINSIIEEKGSYYLNYVFVNDTIVELKVSKYTGPVMGGTGASLYKEIYSK